VLQLRGFEMVKAGPLPPGDRFEAPAHGWGRAMVARALSTESPEDIQGLLTEAERDEISARGNPQRRADRLLGRVAAKRAVSALTGRRPDRFRIQSAASGEPLVLADDGTPMPRVSISHRDGEAMAIATEKGRPGIDLEIVEERHPSFAETWFRPSEREWTAGIASRESQVWAIKEAVLKALGTGMRLDPRDVEVVSVRDETVEVRLWGEVSDRHAALGRGDFTVTIEEQGTMVVAIAWMAS
jgi:phosphopantetheine--protein transferase-like protein